MRDIHKSGTLPCCCIVGLQPFTWHQEEHCMVFSSFYYNDFHILFHAEMRVLGKHLEIAHFATGGNAKNVHFEVSVFPQPFL